MGSILRAKRAFIKGIVMKIVNTALSLDLGTFMGWASYDNGKYEYGTVNFSIEPYSENMILKSFQLKKWLQQKINSLSPEIIVYEQVLTHKGYKANKTYNSFENTVSANCLLSQIPMKAVPVTRIKKFAAGSGAAPKSEMIEAVKRMGHMPKDDNQADALALLEYTINHQEVWNI